MRETGGNVECLLRFMSLENNLGTKVLDRNDEDNWSKRKSNVEKEDKHETKPVGNPRGNGLKIQKYD